MAKISFKTRSGKKISFTGKARKKSPARTLTELDKRLKNLKSPKMRKNAREKWIAARSFRGVSFDTPEDAEC